MNSLKELKEMIYLSIDSEAGTLTDLMKRDFLKNRSREGINRLIDTLVKENKLFEKELDNGDCFYSTYDSKLDKKDLIVGNIYCGKRRNKTYFNSTNVYTDRKIISFNGFSIQYDSPSIKIGQIRPVVSMNEFLNWVKADVTKDSTDGKWISVN